MITTNEVDTFCASFAPWGYRDIERAIEVYKEAGKNEADLAEAVQSFSDDKGMKLEDIDVCYVAYDSVYQEARTDIESATGKDICNDRPYDGVYIYGNYTCTCLDAKEEVFSELAKLIDTIPEADRSEAVKWLREEINCKV